jgi:hypothetical protein
MRMLSVLGYGWFSMCSCGDSLVSCLLPGSLEIDLCLYDRGLVCMIVGLEQGAAKKIPRERA